MSEEEQKVEVIGLQIEHLQETLGIGTATPRLSWRVQTDTQNWYQQAYEIECYNKDNQLRGTTGRIESNQSILVDWQFEALKSREIVSLRVRVWGADASASDWSAALKIEVGLLQADDWGEADFITADWDEDNSQSNPSPYLRRVFELASGLKSARLYITALGVYEAQINGDIVGNHVLAPGWTAYEQHLRYQTFDVTEMLKEGQNVLGVILGDGWYRGRLGFDGGRRNIYGEKLGLLARLEVEYKDGSSETIISDENWQATTGAILKNSIYDGENYDARLELGNWSSSGYDASSWKAVRRLEWDKESLKATVSPPVRRTEELSPISISQSPSGKILVDFGQNIVGRVRISVQGETGQTITLRHAEVLENGELGTRPLRTAEATDSYTLKGDRVEIWEPRFTFHGFRYVELEGCSGEIKSDNITAIVIHSDMKRIGWFECSDSLLNQLHENVVWGMRGNFLDIPTDCPQRDERLGWTGDLEVFSPTASFLYDVSGFLQSWLYDLAIEQEKLAGAVPHVVPNILGDGAGAAAWADAATIVPYILYQRYGDVNILKNQFESMRSWVDHVHSLVGDNMLWDKGFQFGDWLDPTAPPDQPGKARTEKTIVATAYFARSAEIVGQTAAVLAYREHEEHYLGLAKQIREAIADEYITANGRMASDTETAFSLALVFDLIPTEEQRQRAGNRLAELVRESGYHIRTGFVGTPLICDALCSTGHHDIAYRLLMQQECPSWLYPVTMGATTIWERWDSMLPDASINPGEMTSFNHYALGAVADWMQRTIGGLATADAAYRKLNIHPVPGAGITSAHVKHKTPYGMAECKWAIEGEIFNMSLVVPPNTSATVTLPDASEEEVGSGLWHWSISINPDDYRNSYTLDSIVADIMYDKAAREVVMKAASQVEVPGFFFAILDNERHLSLRQLAGIVHDGGEFAELLEKGLSDL